MAKNQRKLEEQLENKETVSNGAPNDKYQGIQQVAPSTGFNVDAGETNFTLKKNKNGGSTLKQDVAASVIKDASMGGSLSGDGASFAGMRSSGSIGGVLGAANATPVAGKARSDSRTSKKNDRNSTKLNFIPSDQVLTEWDESKPLADARDLDQGFNGTYRNEFARSQKNKEAVPGALMFDRSVDLIVKDNVYFGQGQKVEQAGVTLNEDLSQVATPDAVTGIYKYPASEGTSNYLGGHTGNYINDNVEILITEDGRPVYTVYNETELPAYVDQFEANKASAQNHILMNDAELVRETMDAKAGDEKADIWTPLARAVRKPTQLVGFLRDVEAGVGDEVLTAYRKFGTSMSFQLNRAHKDGQIVDAPAILACKGLNFNPVSNAAADTTLGTDIQNDLFNRNAYIHGDASTMVALYDSVGKYNTKADFLIQPRSFRMHLQTADNNMDPLHVGKLFDQVYSNQEVFSTIDREYDPMAPVCMTDKASVAHRISWHKMGSYVYDSMDIKVADKSTTAQTDFVLVPLAMVAELKDAGYNVYFDYPHETNGDIDNYTNGVITPDAAFEWENGKKCRLWFSKTDYAFSTSKAYFIGDLVLYGKVWYRFKANHAAGSWSAGDVDAVEFSTGVSLGGYQIANDDINTSYAIKLSGSGSTSHKVAVTDVKISNGAVKIYAYQGGPAVYMYNDLRNNYVVNVTHPLTEGFEQYLCDSIGAKYYSLITHNNAYIAPITINTVHSTMFFSLWSIMLCAATPYIIKARINSFRDVLYYEKNIEYPFSSTLLPIRDVLTKAYTNFKYSDYDTELETGTMNPAAALNWVMPELFQAVGYDSSNSEVKVLLPWYACQNEVRYLNGSYSWDDDASAMCFPSIRSGVRFAPLDTLYGMTEKDVRLSLDKIASFKNLFPTLSRSLTYKYSTVGDGQLILAVSPDYLDARTIMSLPRELGFVMTAPYGVLTPTYAGDRGYATEVCGTTSFRCYYWLGANATATDDQGHSEILNPLSINVDRAQNFKQDWFCVLASGTLPTLDHGFVLSANQAYNNGALLNGRTEFKPFTSLADNAYGSTTTGMNYLHSIQKYLWTRIQKLPFVINPFDGLVIDRTNSPNNVIVVDPFDFLYCLGLGGFRASDYRESVYNREKEVVNQGTLFVSDPWILASPIFKEGSITTNIVNSKGFELK